MVKLDVSRKGRFFSEKYSDSQFFLKKYSDSDGGK